MHGALWATCSITFPFSWLLQRHQPGNSLALELRHGSVNMQRHILISSPDEIHVASASACDGVGGGMSASDPPACLSLAYKPRWRYVASGKMLLRLAHDLVPPYTETTRTPRPSTGATEGHGECLPQNTGEIRKQTHAHLTSVPQVLADATMLSPSTGRIHNSGAWRLASPRIPAGLAGFRIFSANLAFRRSE